MKHKDTKLVYSTDPSIKQQIDDDKKSAKESQVKNIPPGKQSLKKFLQTKGRNGKKVTLIQGFQHDFTTLNQLARELKKYCGAGGTIKGQNVEIQGDKRKRVAEKLSNLGYQVPNF